MKKDKKDKKNKGRKSITAVGAKVAAGLTPAIVAGSPASQPPTADVELTAADAVSIDGQVLDFDELFAMQQTVSEQQIVHKTVYGPRPPRRVSSDEQQATIRAKARQDSIRRAEKPQPLVYGPRPGSIREEILQDSSNLVITEVDEQPTVINQFVGAEELRSIAGRDRQQAIDMVLEALMDYCSQMLNPDANSQVILSEDGDLMRQPGMSSSQLEMLQEEIESSFGVLIGVDMLKQLRTLRRISNFVVTAVAPTRKD